MVIDDDDVEADDHGFCAFGSQAPAEANLVVVAVRISERCEDEVRELGLCAVDEGVDSSAPSHLGQGITVAEVSREMTFEQCLPVVPGGIPGRDVGVLPRQVG